MAYETEAGTFTLNTGTGNQTVTLANGSLTPKAVICWTTRQTADGFTTDAIFFIGFATSTTARCTFGTTSQDAQASSVADRTGNTTKLLETRLVNSGLVQEAFDLVSFGAGEFVINVTTAGTGIKVHYLVLGGDDLTNANAIGFNSRTTAGTQNVTGAGFQPDCIIILDSFLPVGSGSGIVSIGGLGWGTAADQCAIGWSSNDGAATMDTRRTQRSGQIIAVPSQVSDAYLHLADLSSLDADGFSLNWTTANGTARQCHALCLKGGQYEAGVETQKTSTAGTKATTTAFQPTGLLLGSFCRDATASVVAHARLSFGAASSATARAASWMGDTDAAADSECDRGMQQDQCLTLADAGSPAAFAAAADLSSFNATDFTLDWDDGAGGNPDATAREFIWLAFGSDAAVGGTILPQVMQHYFGGVA